MEKKKIDRIIQIVRENMTVGVGGFTDSADPKGPVSGFDPVINFLKRKKKYPTGGKNSRKPWLQYLKGK